MQSALYHIRTDRRHHSAFRDQARRHASSLPARKDRRGQFDERVTSGRSRAERLGQIVEEIEEYLVSNYEKEVSSQTIGERIAAVLRRVDKVSYVRFASIYRQFEDVGEFIEEAQDVIERSAEDIPGQKNLFEGPVES